jgi:hypothetical protein
MIVANSAKSTRKIRIIKRFIKSRNHKISKMGAEKYDLRKY